MLKTLGSFILLCSFACGQKDAPPVNQYTGDANIQELSSTDFDSVVHCIGKDFSDCPAYVVQFYTSASAYSRNYSVEFKQIGPKTIELQKKIMRIAAINCHVKTNEELCNLHGFHRMPLLKYFYRQSPVSYLGKVFETNTRAEHILRRISEQVNAEYWQKAYPDWPNFNQLPGFLNLTRDIWEGTDITDCNTGYLLIIVNKTNDVDGMNYLIKARNSAHPSVPVRRITKDHSVARLINDAKMVYPEPIMFKRKEILKDCPTPDEPSDFKSIIGSMGIGSSESEEKTYDNGAIVERRKERYGGVLG